MDIEKGKSWTSTRRKVGQISNVGGRDNLLTEIEDTETYINSGQGPAIVAAKM